MTVLVTGGTGFLGSHVAARLAETGHAVRLLVRDRAKLARVPALAGTGSIDVVVGDVTDRHSVERALDGCTAVVHAAAHVSLAERDAARAEAVNVGGTRIVVGGASERALPTVYVSSVSVFGLGSSPITIASPLTGTGGGYTRSKVAAERFVRELQEQRAPVSIVYPSGVLGPDTPDLNSTYLGLVGWVRTPPRTTSGCSIVDVRDVALAIERALDVAPARWMLGGTFLSYCGPRSRA
ncbi:MAG TPA: SDR family NAD(P)-dependent oxidoreductase [Acidimicrobiia bacterium]|nr:SDR family NAD(P)-dependent oxidoreductase [Acidimicrobiia bacterium]